MNSNQKRCKGYGLLDGSVDNISGNLCSNRFRVLLFLVVCLFPWSLYLLGYIELDSIRTADDMTLSKNLLNADVKGFLINTQGCKIPEMNPFDASVKAFVSKPDMMVCNKNIPPLFDSNLTSIYLVEPALKHYNISNSTELTCCYKSFWREDPKGSDNDKQMKFSENCTNIEDFSAYIIDEFIKVTCDYETKQIYEDYFAFVPKKRNESIDRSDRLKPNILIVGLDAVSRVNFHRQMPRTLGYLVNKLGAVEMLGYNKVADNTFVNLMPVLSGHFVDELKQTCWPNDTVRFDDCSFLWNNFSDKGYATTFGEDCAWMGIFNFVKRGFGKQPVDYYYSPYSWITENAIGNDKDFNCELCLGGRKVYSTALDYVSKVVQTMAIDSQPHFTFFWTVSLSHDYLNYPSLGDSTYYNFFKRLKDDGLIENTVVVFMSDHGIRWGDIRQTYQGQLEERLPFVYIVVPDWIRTEYPKSFANLKRNSRRLTTPFDLHETLKSFLHVESLGKEKVTVDYSSRSYSLFDEVPANRTCESAEISAHWCTCQQSVDVNVSDASVIEAAQFAVGYMNDQLRGYAQCVKLTLDDILNARLLYHTEKEIEKGNDLKDYTVTIRTTPGEGVFEATVRVKNNVFTAVTGTVSRLNLYGKQSSCMTDFHLKLYCYCDSLLKTF
ncbi:uncharacterized protein LOC115880669 isoform X3 [Sitophilus oryzae]|uniref:Uncharacterized protein LOC115880669 isoform X3 n=1 Tax=Sitophilus oryzae TaxID=7048 RepID=A0A6J2XQZ6_SITOR|nr:uncharacterized protein LOC115880669 isoform X3 [Sitophilus oryzae]